MLKIFFLLLLSVNVALFGFNYGLWGAKAHESHEPQRLKAQLHTEKLQLRSSSVDKARTVAPEPILAPPASAAVAEPEVPPAAPPEPVVAQVAPAVAPTPAPKPAPLPAPVVPQAEAKADLVCLEFAYFNTPDAQKFDAALARLPLKTKPLQRSVEEIVSYMVHVPTTDGRTGAEKKAAELRRQGVGDFYIMPGSYAIAALRWNISLGVFKTERAAKSFVAELTAQGIKGLKITPRKSGATRLIYQLREVDGPTQERLTRIMQNFKNQKMSNCQ